MYVFLNPTTGAIEVIDKDSVIIEAPDDYDFPDHDDELFNSVGDDTRLAVFPVIDFMEWKESDQGLLEDEDGNPFPEEVQRAFRARC